jgi:hypothetical protein
MLQVEGKEMRIAVISAGVRFLPERFANILASAGYDAKFYPLDRRTGYAYVDWSSVDVAWGIGFFFECDQLYDALKSKYPHIKIVNTWVGTDLLNTLSFVRARPKCKKCLLKSIDVHVVDDVGFAKELKDWLGVESVYFVPSIPDPMPLRPLPTEFAVGVYIPPHRKDFYGYPIIVEAAKQLFDVPFYIFAWNNTDKEKTPPPLPNVHFIGFVEGDEKLDWFGRCSANITIPMHGGVSLTLIEFMQMGRRCVSNKKLPYAYYVEETEMPNGIVERLKEIMKFKEPDEEASKHYREEYSPKKVVEHVKPVLEAL